MPIAKNPIVRVGLLVLGVASVILGAIGIFLPVLPTTPFILLATWCFIRSSERAHDWLYRQPIFGEALRSWEANRAIARSNKIMAIAAILVSLFFIWLKVENDLMKYGVTLLLLSVSIFIATRNEK